MALSRADEGAGALLFPQLPATLKAGDILELRIEGAGLNRFEYRWLLKEGAADWNWNASWTQEPLFRLSVPRAGMYAVQVDIRDRRTGNVVLQKWLGQVSVLESPPASAPPAGVPCAPDRPLTEADFILPVPPEELAVGEAACLTVEPLVPGPFEYRWLHKQDDADWNWSAPWTPVPTYVFHPDAVGFHSLHVDIRRRGRQDIALSRWLGATVVTGPLVGQIFYSPAATALPTGVPIEFFILPGVHAIEDLEFRLWDLLPEEKVVHDWRPWPLPPFVCMEPRTTALQVDIRLKRLPQVIDRRWLNTFSFFERPAPSPANLLRNLAGDDFEVFSFSHGIDVLARELWLATHLLEWQFEGVASDEIRQRLEALEGVTAVKSHGRRTLLVRMANGRNYEIHPQRFTLRQVGSPVLLRLRLDDYPRYREALELMGHLPPEVRIAGLMTLAVYEGYHYGTPPFFSMMHVTEVLSHCGTQVDQLRRILTTCGLHSEFVSLTSREDQNNSAAHGLLQTCVLGETPMLIDPTNGYLYLYDIADLGFRAIPEPIILPQCRDLSQLDLRLWAARSIRVTVVDETVPNCVPLTPAGGVVFHLPAPAASP